MTSSDEKKKKLVSLKKVREERGEETPADIFGDDVGVVLPGDEEIESETLGEYVERITKKIEWMMDRKDCISIDEAAEMMNCSTAYVVREIEHGRVTGCALKVLHVLSKRSVEEWCMKESQGDE